MEFRDRCLYSSCTAVGNVNDALKSYERAYETDDRHYTSMLNAAKLLQSHGHTNQSKELIERYN